MIDRRAVISGVVGAGCLTMLHEVARQFVPRAPRVDVLGMRAIARSFEATGHARPSRSQLYWLALLGDFVSNSLYYSLIASGDRRGLWRRGMILGGAAGLGAAVLPRPLGLGRQPNQQFPTTHLMTIAWYLLGGLAAAATAQVLDSDL